MQIVCVFPNKARETGLQVGFAAADVETRFDNRRRAGKGLVDGTLHGSAIPIVPELFQRFANDALDHTGGKQVDGALAGKYHHPLCIEDNHAITSGVDRPNRQGVIERLNTTVHAQLTLVVIAAF
jgi:hypothetical protein